MAASRSKTNYADLADFLLLGNTYDRKARLAPGLIVVLPWSVVATVFAGKAMSDWIGGLAIGLLAELTLAVLFGYVAHTVGSRLEYAHLSHPDGPLARAVCVDVEGVCPSRGEHTHCPEQREAWRHSLRKATNIPISDNSPEGMSAAFNAYKQLVVKACGRRATTAKADMTTTVKACGEDYGFARNLVGLLPFWAFSTIVAGLLCMFALDKGVGLAAVAVGVESLFLVAVLLVGLLSIEFIDTTAQRFIESLLEAAGRMEPEAAKKDEAAESPGDRAAAATNRQRRRHGLDSWWPPERWIIAWARKVLRLAWPAVGALAVWAVVFAGYFYVDRVWEPFRDYLFVAPQNYSERQAEAFLRTQLLPESSQDRGDTVRINAISPEVANEYCPKSTIPAATFAMLADASRYPYSYYFKYSVASGRGGEAVGYAAVYRQRTETGTEWAVEPGRLAVAAR